MSSLYRNLNPVHVVKSTAMRAERIINAVASWAIRDDRVGAALLCGSYARGNPRADSDIDLVLIANEPSSLLDNPDWVYLFGDADVVGIEDWGLVQSIRVLYGNQEVEFGIAGLEWVKPPIDRGTAMVLRQRVRILHDPELLIAKAITAAGKSDEAR